QDFFAMKMINHLCQANNDRRKGWPTRPVAVVYTKADHAEACSSNPSQYTQRRLPSLWKLCQEQLKQCEFFATSVTAATAYYWEYGERVNVPLRIEPRGITQPFEWLVDSLPK
ncbi:MAG: hypothetical protein QGF59_30215, partial [Pirellulaceae bacterium]|nr:hypothetical protein [Pirellulaceae bacterium]